MLENSEERVKLLKMGFPIKTIEYFYIKYNNFKIVDIPVLTGRTRLDFQSNKKVQEMKPMEAYPGEEDCIQVA